VLELFLTNFQLEELSFSTVAIKDQNSGSSQP